MTRISTINAWTTVGLAMFSLAAWQDGAKWTSGILAGVVLSWVLDHLFAWVDEKAGRTP
jgi:hypothetical protein